MTCGEVLTNDASTPLNFGDGDGVTQQKFLSPQLWMQHSQIDFVKSSTEAARR